MPFIHWFVEPKYLSRSEVNKSFKHELETVSNNTLVEVVHQLACIAKYANWIFDDVAKDIKGIQNRTIRLRTRINHLENVVSTLNAKKVSVPVGDLTAFSRITDHYVAQEKFDSCLFSAESRPLCVQLLYNESLLSPVHVMREIDKYRQDGCRSSKYFVCTPVFTDKQHAVDLEIETRRPSSTCVVQEEQLDKDLVSTKDSEEVDSTDGKSNILKRLPSPEERSHALSLKYPYSDVPIDVTGSGFRRMASFRRSLVQQVEFLTRKRKKKKKSDRRNTISDTEDIQLAIEKEKKNATSKESRKRFSMAETLAPYKENAVRFAYNSLRRSKESKSVQTSEDNSLKVTEKRNNNNIMVNEEETKASVSKNSEKKFKNKLRSIIPISTLSQAMSVAVKMRDNTARNSAKEDSGQSSSGNWSASSSTRTSVESEKIQTALSETTRIPSQTSLSRDSALSGQTYPTDDIQSNDSYQSSTSAEIRESPNLSKLINRRRESDNFKVSKEDSHTGEGTDGTSTTGTLTPLLGRRPFSPFDKQMAFMDDEESSVYSIDTDGYYTSMHTDSGLRSMSSSNKPLEMDDKNQAENNSSDNNSTLSSVSSIEQTDNEKIDREHESRKSTQRPPPEPPARYSSLKKQDVLGESEGNNVESLKSETLCHDEKDGSPPPSSELDFENQENFKRKTSINTSRIPSMVIVTPNQSDDEEGGKKAVYNVPSEQFDSENISNIKEDSGSNSATLKRSSSIEKVVSCNRNNGFYTVPRNFQRNTCTLVYPNNTHSWPRTLNSNGSVQNKRVNSFNSNINYLTSFNKPVSLHNSNEPDSIHMSSLNSSSDKEIPLLPLKYVQHITVTPVKRDVSIIKETNLSSSSQLTALKHVPVLNVAEKGSLTSNEKKITDTSQGKIIYASFKLEKKNENANRSGAHVTLDHDGQVVHTNNPQDPLVKTNKIVQNKSTSLTKDSNSDVLLEDSKLKSVALSSENPVYQNISNLKKNQVSLNVNPNRQKIQQRPPPLNYNSNTLPCLKRNNTIPYVNSADSSKSSATFPRSYNSVKRSSVNGSNSSVDSQGSKGSPGSSKSPLPTMPPPMSLISPSVTQASRRWSISGLMGSTDYSVLPPNSLLVNNSKHDDVKSDQNMSGYYQHPFTEKESKTTTSINVNQRVLSPIPRIPPVDNSLRYNSNNFYQHPVISPKQNTNPVSQINQRQLLYQYPVKRSSSLPTYENINNSRDNKNNILPSNVVHSSPPPPPNRQYKLLQKNTSASPSLIPQYTLLRTSTPSSSTPLARRNLDWSVPESPKPSGDINQNHYSQLVRRENLNNSNKLSQFPDNSICYRNENLKAKILPKDNETSAAVKQPFGSINSQNVNKQNNSENTLGKLEKMKKSTMSADELFAIIHQSKKRLNIKNDNDLSSSPISSRSASPALSTSSLSSHSNSRENGYTNSHFYSLPGDRRSWSGDMSSSTKNGFNSPEDRRSWAIDRLGPPRPTSMRDFKMLLLQAGRNGIREESPRKSAVEMLKSTAPKKENSNMSTAQKLDAHKMKNLRSPLKNQFAESIYDSPNNLRNIRPSRSPLNQSPSQFSRGRMRASFHTRTDILSTPILEDNTEDMEEEEGNYSDYSINLNSQQNRMAAPCLI